MHTAKEIARRQQIERVRRQGLRLPEPTEGIVRDWLKRPRVAIVALVATKYDLLVTRLMNVADWAGLNTPQPGSTFEVVSVHAVPEVIVQ